MCSIYKEKKDAQERYESEQRFNNKVDNEVLNKRLPTLVTTRDDEFKYIYLKSSCRQVAKRITDGALAVNIDQETGVKEDDDGDIIDGQFIDRSQTTPCSTAVLGIADGQPTRADLRMRRKAEVLQYKNKNTNRKTKAQRYADAVRNRTKGTGASGQQNEDIGTNPNPNEYTKNGNTLIMTCPFNSVKYVSTSRSGVPGRKTLLFLDSSVTLRDYL
jgi:hypothetical protein